ncbi:hypothetical protein D9M71_670470 [compost metagenome]
MGEIHRLLAVFVDGHRRQGHVDLLHLKGRNQAVELALDPHALDLHLRAQGIADVVVEARDLAFVGLGGEWWVGRFDTDAQGFLGGKQGAARQQAQGQTGDEGEFLHVRSLAGCCWFGKTEERAESGKAFFVLRIPYWTFMYLASIG